MSRRNINARSASRGFTLVEMLVVMAIAGLASVTLFTFANTAIKRYFPLHEEGLAFSEMSIGAQRIASVVRGLTDINAATSDNLDIYAYFSPQDVYVSQISYYKSNGKLLADITPMTANPPIGIPIIASKKTYTIISDLFVPNGTQTFVYLDGAGAPLSMPISDLHGIKGVQVNLGVPLDDPAEGGSNTISLEVTLRNRKTNL